MDKFIVDQPYGPVGLLKPSTPIFVAASTGLLHGAVELSRFGGRAATVSGCDLRQRFVVSARAGKARATSGPRAAPARFSSGASAVMPKQQADTRCALAAVARRTRGTDVIELQRVAACYDCQSSLPIEASMRVLGCCDADSCETLVRLYLGTGTEVWAFYYSSTTRSAETPEPFPRTRSPQHRDSKLKFRRARSRPIASREI